MKTPKKPSKSDAARRIESGRIGSQIDALGIPEELLTEVRAALEEFAINGHGVTKTVRLPDLGAGISLLLSTQPHIVSYARIHSLRAPPPSRRHA